MSADYRYRWEVESAIEIYREHPVKRYMIATLGGYFPVLLKLRSGKLACFTESGDFHEGERGRIDLVTSDDGGESWSWARPIVTRGPDARNQAAIQTSDGTLLLVYVHAAYVNGQFDPTRGYRTVYLIRSNDDGQTWSEPEPIVESSVPSDQFSPYGKMIELPDRTILLTLYYGDRTKGEFTSNVLRSRDGGKTWGDRSLVAAGYDETALLYLPSGKIIAVLRRTASRNTPNAVGHLFQCDSEDLGYTWSEPRPVTGPHELPADLLLLKSGKILLTFGHRSPPYGVRALLSHDEGRTWDHGNKITLLADCSTADCGYPSSVQLDDGSIFTAYYCYQSPGPFRAARLGAQLTGPHAAGVKYREEDLV